MTENPNQAGGALLIPSYALHAGRFSARRRWGTPEDSYPEDPGQLADVQRHYRNQRIHVLAPEGWSSDDLRAIEALEAREMIVIAEGRLTTREAISSVADAGADALILEPSFVADELEFVESLPVGIFLVVESPRTSLTIIKDMTLVRDGRFDGIVTAETTKEGLDIAQMLGLIDQLDWPDLPVVLARVPIESASKGRALLEEMQPLGVSKLVDGEFLLNMVRFSRSEVVVETIRSSDG